LEHLSTLLNEIHHRDSTIRILLNIGLFEGSHGILRRVEAAGIYRRCRRKRKQ
jgi:hypothetical protein